MRRRKKFQKRREILRIHIAAVFAACGGMLAWGFTNVDFLLSEETVLTVEAKLFIFIVAIVFVFVLYFTLLRYYFVKQRRK